jgi:hypothetical protein
MRLSNFEQFERDPESRRTSESLRHWLSTHQRHTIEPRRLARELPNISPSQLAIALQLLVKDGVLRQVYKVRTPSGVLADEEFDDPRNVPERLPDRFDHYFDTSEADIVPVFKQRQQ